MTDGITDLVLERIDEGYLLVSGGGTVVAANRAARSLLGMDDLVGADVRGLPPGVGDLVTGEDGAPNPVELSVDGESSFVEVEVTAVDGVDVGDGTADRLVLLRDVSDRVGRNRYRRIFAASGDAVYTIDTEGVCTFSNRAHDELYGYEESEMVGLHVSEILEEAVIERLEGVVRDLLRTDGARRAVVEHEVIAADGRRIPVENHVSLLFDGDGEFRGTAGVVRDVTERREREEQLERYERIVEAMGDGVYILDADGAMGEFNEFMVELTGYDRETMLGAEATLWHDEEDVERFRRAIRELLSEDDPGVESVEASLRTADGDEVPIEVNLTLLTGEDGEFRGSVGVVRDITERKEREQELERYETLLGIMPDTVVVTDTDGNIVDLHGFEGWSGYSREELVGEHLSKTSSREDIETAEELIGELVRDDDREKITYEMDVLTKDGELVPHENNLALLPPDEDGMIPGSMSVLRDISDRKERERAMRTLHDATREMVVADSKEAVATVTYEAAADVLGLTQTGVHFYDEDEEALVPIGWTSPLEEALGEPPALGPDSLAWSVFEDGEAVFVDDFRDEEGVYNPDTPFRSEMIVDLGEHGVALFASTEPGAFDADDQRFVEVLCSNAAAAMDRIGREEDLRERERELERQNERLEEFASVVSHDLRNPLNVAHARVKMTIESADTGSLEKADAALVRMNELIEDLLALAREGEAVGEMEPVDLASVARDAWESVEAPDASLAVDLDRTVEADRARLAELFGNLYRNAIEHGGEDVTIHVGALSGEDGFYVEDDGPGIPPDVGDAIFEHGVTGSEDGTGFGLAIVEDIAEAHGWSVRATEGTTGGARFEFVPERSADEEGPPR